MGGGAKNWRSVTSSSDGTKLAAVVDGDGSIWTSRACSINENVISNLCQPCPSGTTNDPGDNAVGVDTACDAVICRYDQRVQNNECVMVCPESSIDFGIMLMAQTRIALRRYAV